MATNKKTNSVSLATLERNAKIEMIEELNGPFAVINAINKKAKDKNSNVFAWLEELGVKKVTSDMCLTKLDYRKSLILENVPTSFLKLRKYESVKNANDILDSIVLKDVRYALVPCKFTIADFFASLRDARRIAKVREEQATATKQAKLEAIMLKLRNRTISDEERNRLIDEYEAIAAA